MCFVVPTVLKINEDNDETLSNKSKIAGHQLTHLRTTRLSLDDVKRISYWLRSQIFSINIYWCRAEAIKCTNILPVKRLNLYQTAELV